MIGLAFEKGGSATAVDQTCSTEVISNSCALNLSQDVDLFLGHHLLLLNYSVRPYCAFSVFKPAMSMITSCSVQDLYVSTISTSFA